VGVTRNALRKTKGEGHNTCEIFYPPKNANASVVFSHRAPKADKKEEYGRERQAGSKDARTSGKPACLCVYFSTTNSSAGKQDKNKPALFKPKERRKRKLPGTSRQFLFAPYFSVRKSVTRINNNDKSAGVTH